MIHESVALEQPIEFLEITSINPLISKCKIKVCYVQDTPNRNRSVITKKVAKEIAQSLPGSPIVGYYNESKEDFEEHNRIIDISNGLIKIKDTTKPYGFIDLNAKVWFQKFLDDGEQEHEYLCTEGFLWTGQYPECERVISKGNNESMELDEDTLDATWSKDSNKKNSFFIINEAIISKLCILGDEAEPCFEGSRITNFSFDDNFTQRLFSMMNEIRELLNKGGVKVDPENTLNEAVDSVIESEESVIETTDYAKEEKNQDKEEKENTSKTDDKTEDSEEKCPKCGNPLSECKCAKKKKYVLDDIEFETYEEVLQNIPEYTDLSAKYTELEEKYNALISEKTNLEAENNSLKDFKLSSERKDKESMIESFYMLSDEDKADVISNIDTYSIDDIEAKLSIICVRNKVSFSTEEDNHNVTTYNLEDTDEEEAIPAWVKAALNTAKNLH